MTLAHVREGAGPPLLLVHGIGQSHHAWALTLPLLSPSRECVAVDLPGFGDSDPLNAAPTVPALAAACCELMAELGFESFAVAGLSLGGAIALELAATEAVTSACAVAPIGFVAAGWEQRYLQASLMATRATVIALLPVAPVVTLWRWARKALLAQLATHGERVPPSLLLRGFFDLARARGFADTRRAALGWACPPSAAAGASAPPRITVAWGDKDRLLLFGRQSRRARSRLPAATHVTLADAGHRARVVERGEVAGAVLAATASG